MVRTPKQLYQELQTRYEDTLFRSLIYSKNWSRWHTNHLIQRRSPDPLLGTLNHFSCITGYRPIMKIPSWYSDSPQKMGPGANWTIQIGEGHPTLPPHSSWIWLYKDPQWEFQIFLFRFGFSLKNGSIPFLSIADATGQIGSWDLDILNPLEKWV
jgi:hypothetical protein